MASVSTTSLAASRTPASRPASRSAQPSSSTCTPTSAANPETSARPSSRLNQNLPPSSASLGSERIAASSSPTHGRTSRRPPDRPDSGDATMLRTRSCVSDGNSPAPAISPATAGTSVIPRSCTLPRAVSSRVPEPNSFETRASVASWAAVIMPPGSRTRARVPSAASCTCSAPGQASVSRALAICSRYGSATLPDTGRGLGSRPRPTMRCGGSSGFATVSCAAVPTEAATHQHNESMKVAIPQAIWAIGSEVGILAKDGDDPSCPRR